MLYTPLLPRRPPARSSRGTSSCRCARCAPMRSSCSGARRHSTSALARSRPTRSPGRPRSRYERLVVALGAVDRVFPVPGLVEHGRGFKDLADAIALRNHVLQRLEAAAAGGPPSELGFVFVGPATRESRRSAELNDLAQAALRYYPTLRDDTAALGARRCGSGDPPRDPTAPGGVRRAAARARAESRSTSARRSPPTTARRPSSPTGPRARPHARLDGRREGLAAATRLRPAARRARPCARRRDRCASRGRRTSGRSATARPCPTPALPGTTDPPTCQHAFARLAGSRRT